jgi:uncharacterized membrane protein
VYVNQVASGPSSLLDNRTIVTDSQESETAEPIEEQRLPGRVPGPNVTLREMLTDRRAWIDGMIPPLLFLATNAIWGLVPAAIAAITWAVGTLAYRLARRHKSIYAVGGIFGLALALGFALLTGRASTYFLPNAVIGAVYGLIGLGSIAIGRPLSTAIARVIDQRSREWYAQPRVRNTHIVVTATWSLFMVARSAIRYYLITIDSEWGLAVTTIALGLPATGLLLVGSWAFIKRRLGGLVEPPPGSGEAG